MPIALGAHTLKVGSTTDPVTTTGITTTSGDTLYVFVVDSNANAINSVTDNKGNTYTQIGTKQTAGSAAGWAYRCSNAVGGAGHTVTVDFASAADPSVFFGAITGAAAASFDVAAQGTDTTSPYTLASPTTTQANELLLSLCFSDRTGTFTRADSTGFTGVDQSTDGNTYWTGALASKVVSATGVYTPSWTETGGAPNSSVIGLFVVAFKEAAGGGTTVVGQSADLRANLAALVGQTLDQRWNTSSLVNSTVDQRWNTAALINRLLDTRWNVSQLAGKDAQLTWDALSALGTVFRETALRWDSAQQAGAAVQARWDVSSAVSQALQAQWDGRSLTGTPLALQYGLLASAASELGLSWEQRRAVHREVMLELGSIGGSVSRELNLTWGGDGQTLEVIYASLVAARLQAMTRDETLVDVNAQFSPAVLLGSKT